ncbi:hypothetical protein ACFXTN_039670 [Malus domestica]
MVGYYLAATQLLRYWDSEISVSHVPRGTNLAANEMAQLASGIPVRERKDADEPKLSAIESPILSNVYYLARQALLDMPSSKAGARQKKHQLASNLSGSCVLVGQEASPTGNFHHEHSFLPSGFCVFSARTSFFLLMCISSFYSCDCLSPVALARRLEPYLE